MQNLEGLLLETMEKYKAELNNKDIGLRTYYRLRKEFTGLYKCLEKEDYDMSDFSGLYMRLIYQTNIGVADR